MLYLMYYFACVFYAITRSYKKWLQQDLGANTMELIMILTIGFILAPIDFGIVWYKHFHGKKEKYQIDIDIKNEDIY